MLKGALKGVFSLCRQTYPKCAQLIWCSRQLLTEQFLRAHQVVLWLHTQNSEFLIPQSTENRRSGRPEKFSQVFRWLHLYPDAATSELNLTTKSMSPDYLRLQSFRQDARMDRQNSHVPSWNRVLEVFDVFSLLDSSVSSCFASFDHLFSNEVCMFRV